MSDQESHDASTLLMVKVAYGVCDCGGEPELKAGEVYTTKSENWPTPTGIPDSARLSDEQIEAIYYPDGPTFYAPLFQSVARAAADHAYHSRDEELSYARRDAFILANEAKELRSQLHAAEELSELWHVAEIAAKRAGCQIKEQLDTAEAEITEWEDNFSQITQTKEELDAAQAQVAAYQKWVDDPQTELPALFKERGQLRTQVVALVETVSAAKECGCHAAACPQFRYTAEEQAEMEREAALEAWNAT